MGKDEIPTPSLSPEGGGDMRGGPFGPRRGEGNENWSGDGISPPFREGLGEGV